MHHAVGSTQTGALEIRSGSVCKTNLTQSVDARLTPRGSETGFEKNYIHRPSQWTDMLKILPTICFSFEVSGTVVALFCVLRDQIHSGCVT